MKKISISVIWLAAAMLFLSSLSVYAQDWYVDAGNSGYADGYNWGTAEPDLQEVLLNVHSGDVVRVAAGIYVPGTSRTDSFVVPEGVKVYGGYPSGGAGIRDWQANPTVLSGNVGNSGSSVDNSYHVVTVSGVGNVHLDGFVITDGNADSSIFANNAGGGLMIINSTADIEIVRCVFKDNQASQYGGALGVFNADVTGMELSFINNHSSSYGGAVYVGGGSVFLGTGTFYGNFAVKGGALATEFSDSDVVLTNTLFSGNYASDEGGALFCGDRSGLLARNVTISGNSSVGFNSGAGISLKSHAVVSVQSSIIWDNWAASGSYYLQSSISVDNAEVYVNYSDIQGDSSGITQINGATVSWNHSIDADPLFVDKDGEDNLVGTEDDNVRLSTGSPCIDAGANMDVVATEDLDGYRRISDDPAVADTGIGFGAIIDMGCYERLSPIYVDAAATGLNDGSSWTNAFRYLQDALAAADSSAGRDMIWVAAGTYRPDQADVAGGFTLGNRFHEFYLDDVEIYGGFSGNETSRSARNWHDHLTVLSGALGGSQYNNSYHVVHTFQHALEALGIGRAVVLDGFTITGGFADNFNNTGNLSKNGAGFYVDQANPLIANCTFSKNCAIGYGAGIYAWYARPRIVNCVFNGNDVSQSNYTQSGYVGGSGGGLAARFSWPEVTNCTFVNNHADDFGGGIYTNSGGLATVVNSIFWNNSDSSGCTENGQLNGPAAVSYSFIQYLDTLAGNHNLTGVPRFIDADGADGVAGTADDDLRLAANSVCVDAGNNAAVLDDILDLDGDHSQAEPWPFDLDQQGRFFDVPAAPDTGTGSAPIVDLGAFESDGLFTAEAMDIYVDDSGGAADGSQAHPFHTIQAAVDVSRSGDTILVEPGIYTGIGNRDVTIAGDKDISLVSLDGAETTTIDCEGLGRGLTLQSGLAGILVSGFTIQNGRTNWGGGLYIRSRTNNVKVEACRFLDNQANLGGGAVGVYGTVALFSDCSFSGSSAYQEGGAVHIEQSTITFRDCNFTDNYSAVNTAGDFGSGGAIYGHQNSCVRIVGSTFWQNSADAFGGAVATRDSDLYCVSDHFLGNAAVLRGGGIHCDNAASPLICNCFFRANTAQAGGGLSLLDSTAVKLVNLTLSGNLATVLQSDCGYLDNTEVKLQNSVYTGRGFLAANGSQMFIEYNLGRCWATSGSSMSFGHNAFMVEPLLTASGHLPATSRGIDSGNNDKLPADEYDLDNDGNFSEPLPVDLDGSFRVRPGNGIVDMGAFEYGSGLLARYSNGIEVLEGPIYQGYSHDCGVTDHNLYEAECTSLDQSPVDWAWGNFSVDWTGYLYAPVGGTYSFSGWVDGTVYFKIGDTVVADFNTNGGGYSGTVELEQGRYTPVTISFASNGGSNNMIFGWTPPGKSWELVPRKYLQPELSCFCAIGDFDKDCDVDGQDLAHTSQVLAVGLADFAAHFGRLGGQ